MQDISKGSGWFLIASALILAIVPGAHADVEVNTCGQTVSGLGYLNADLTCTGMSGPAIILQPGATLDLRGHILESESDGVLCNASCTVLSSVAGGTIRNCPGTAVTTEFQEFTTKVRISDLTLDGNGNGVSVHQQLIASNLTITNTENVALSAAEGRATSVMIDGAQVGISGASHVVDSTVRNAAVGITSGVLRLERTTVTGAIDTGVVTLTAKIRDSHIDDNPGTGIRVGGSIYRRVNVSDSTVSRNGGRGIYGFFDAKVIVRNTSVTDNGLEGIHNQSHVMVKGGSVISGNNLDGVWVEPHTFTCPRLSVRDATVDGNGLDATCGVSRTCADLSSCEKPLVRKTTCSASYDINSGFPGTSWDVCSMD
jgi:hypothetical protein